MPFEIFFLAYVGHCSRVDHAARPQLTAAVVAATTFTDDLPWLYLLTGLAAAFVLPGTSGKTSRSDLAHASASGTGLSGIVVSLQCFASFLAHLVLWHHFHMTASKTVAWHELRTGPQSELLRLRPEQRDRPLLPGGRIDWDIHADDMDAGAAPSSSSALHRPPFATHSSAQQLAAIIVCWLPALWAILCAIAQSGSLPLTNTTTQRQRARGSALTHKADWGR